MIYDPRQRFLSELYESHHDRWRRERIRKRIYFCIYVLLLIVLAVLITYNVRLVRARTLAAGWSRSWMPQEEAERIMRYHGPFHRWRMTAETLEFERDGEWIVAARRN